MIEEKILMAILESKEVRRDKQIELIKKYNGSLISFTLNIPGKIKDSEVYRNIHKEGMKALIKSLEDNKIPLIYKEEIYKTTGPEGYIAVDINPIRLKKLTVDIEENHFLGRIFDIDIFDSNHHQISRKDLGSNPRRCLLCNNDARICMRMKSHTYGELIQEVNRTWRDYDKNITG